jgi:hypothetical protein
MFSQIIIRLGRVPRAVGSTSTSIVTRIRRPLHLLDCCAGLAFGSFSKLMFPADPLAQVATRDHSRP